MQARVDLLLPYGQADAQIHTFHAFGDGLLREHAFELGLPGDVRLINRAESVVLLRDHLFELGLERYRPLGDPTRFLGALADLFGRAKDEGVEPAALASHVDRLRAQATDEALADAAAARGELAAAYQHYQSLLGQNGLIDHGDQLALALRLLRERPQVRQAVVGRYRYLLVDEFQDMNRAQLEMVFALTGQSRSVTVVGDPDQAIYTFRGAAADNVRRFGEIHPDLRRVVLRRNYRSRSPVIDAARRLIGHGPRWQTLGEQVAPVAHRRARRPAPVRLLSFNSPDDEADGVAHEIARRLEAGESARDFAVLARSNAEMNPIVRSLSVRGVAVRTHTPADFFAQPRVRPLLALLRTVADPAQTVELYVLASASPYDLGGQDLTALLADARRRHRSLWDVLRDAVGSPPPDIAPDFLARATRLVADLDEAIARSHERSAGELLYDHLRRSGGLARLANDPDPAAARAVARFFDIVRSRASLLADGRVPSLVPHLDALIEADDELADVGPLDQDAVSVLTVHRAKGLEFRVVYLVGLSEGRFPARGRPSTLDLPWHEIRAEPGDPAEDRLDEERRLCFVAMTRARDELWLSHHRAGPGGRGRRRPSPFIGEALDLPAQAETQPNAELPLLAAPAAAQPPAERSAFVAGQRATFSFSQLEEYLDCPERFRLRHVVGLPTPPHHALSYGRALHEAVAWFHLQVARGETPTEPALLEAFERAWSPEGFLSREHEEARFAGGLDALRRFRVQQLADPAPVAAVERPFDFELDGVRLRGRMDRLDRAAAGSSIVDYKSSDVRDQRKADEKARDSLQLQVYALAHQAATGELPHNMRLHFLDSGVVGRTAPDVARLERARAKIAQAVAGIAAQQFAAKPSPVGCGYCPFRQICPSSAA